MKKFFVSKDDNNRVDFIEKSIQSIKPSTIYILCEKDREYVYRHIENATILPLKELNKNSNWITFINNFDSNSLLIIDNVLKFIFFGDGKKAYLKNVSQKINNIIVTDVVPFYTDPSEIFYPFWFLGKEILGYNSYNSFKANHLEEKQDGSIDKSHSFAVLKDKIKDYYIQDYDNFFSNLEFQSFDLSAIEVENYETAKKRFSENFTNPIKLYSDVSEYINLTESRYDSTKKLLNKIDSKNIVIVNNSTQYTNKHKAKLGDYDFLTFHDNIEHFNKYKFIIFLQLPVVKPYNIFYILALNKWCIQISLLNNKLENHFSDKIYNNELRKQFDKYFYYQDL